MYFFIFMICYVSEMYLDKLQDKQDQTKGIEDTIGSVVEQVHVPPNGVSDFCKLGLKSCETFKREKTPNGASQFAAVARQSWILYRGSK